MSQVTFELTGGIRALRNFMNMLEEAAHVAGVRVKASGSATESGVYLDGRNYWIGINFDEPNTLVFTTWKRPVDINRAELLGVGEVREWDDKKGHLWRRELDLSAESVHFFARPRSSQMQVLESFIRESISFARQIELTDSAAEQIDDNEVART